MLAKILKMFGRGRLFWLSLLICAVVAVVGIYSPQSLESAATTFTRAAFSAIDWFFMASVTGFLVLIIWLALGPYGKLKLGRPEDKPEFTIQSWLAMLFSAGMGIGLLFWGAAEPLTHFTNPPVGQGGTAAAARQALVITNFHWGLHAWAVYGIGALVLAYFGFRHGAPYLAGTPIRHAFRGRWVEPVAWIADLIAVLGVAFGVAGSLGMGVMQIQAGLHVVAGTSSSSIIVSLCILAALVVSYMLSAATSIDKGIKWLSNINMGLAVFLLLYILVTGPTSFLLATFSTSLSDYVSNITSLSLQLYPFADADEWIASWTLTYFIWWIAWAPFVGIFIARISRGRTIREFVLGVLFAPTVISIFWFSIFGGAGLHAELRGDGGLAEAVAADVTSALFALFQLFPGSSFLGVIAGVLIFIFIVTSADSATFVLGMLTSKGSVNPPTARKLSWGLILGAMSAALLFSGNIEAVKAIAVLGAIPFVFVLILQAAALLRTLPLDVQDRDPDDEEEQCD
jgi:glycine betaine transporter